MKSDLKILLFEDSPEDFLLLENALESDALHRISLTRAERLQDGLKLLRHGKFDAILLDLDLPDSHGLKTFEQVVEQAGEIPIVICSGNTDESDAITAVRHGAQDYIVKGTFGYTLAPRTIRYAVERNLGQHQLRASEERFRLLFESMSQGVIYHNENGHIISANPAAQKILSLSLEQMLGRGAGNPNWKVVHEDGSAFSIDQQPAVMALQTGQPVLATIMGITGPAMQGQRWLMVNATPQFRPGESKPYQVYTTLEDITEQKRAEHEIRESETRYHKLFEDSPVAIWEDDFSAVKAHLEQLQSDGHELETYFDEHPEEIIHTFELIKVLDVNKAAVQLYEASDKTQLISEIGKTLPQGFYTHFQMQFKEQLLALSRGKTYYQTETIRQTFKGKLRNVQLTWMVSPGYEQTLSRVLVSLTDITQIKQAEEGLRISQRQMQALVSSLDDIVFEVDRNGTYLNVWTANESLLFAPREAIIGKRFDEIVGVEASQQFFEFLNRVLESDKPQTLEYPVEISGAQRWFAAQYSPIHAAGQVITSVSILVRDITERKQAEDALRRSETQWRTLVQTIPDFVALYDSDGKYLFLNHYAEGFSEADVKGKSYDVFLQDKAVQQYKTALDQARLTGTTQFIEYEGLGDKHETRLYDSYIVPILDETRLTNYLVLARDITDRKNADERLRQSEADLAEAQRIAKLGNWHFDIVRNTVTWSDELYRIFEVDKEAFGGLYDSFLQNVHPADRERVIATNQHARESGETFEIVYRIVTPTRTEKHIREIGYALRDEAGQIIGMFGIAQDITESKMAEMLIAAQRDLARSIATYTTIEAGLQVVLDTVLELTELDSGGIYLFSRDSRTVDLIQHKGLGPEFVEAASSYPIDSINVQMILQGNPIYNSSKDPVVQNPLHIAEGLRALAVVPVLYEKRVIGCLNIASHTLDEIPRSVRQILETLSVEIGNVVLYLQSQAALRTSEENFRQLAETIDETFWIFDNQQQKLVYLNPSYEKTWGVSIEDTYRDNQKYIQIIHPEDRPILFAAIERQAHGEPTQMEYRIVKPDGSIRWIFDRSFPVLGDDGRVLRTTGLATDITERKQAEAALKRRMEDLALTNTMNAAVNQGEDLVAIIDLLSKEVNAIFGGLSASIYLLDEDKKHLDLRHFTIQTEMLTKLEKMIGEATPQISIPMGGDDHYNLALNSSQGFLISGFDGICDWLSDFANTTFLSESSRYVIRKFVPAAARLLNIHSVISIPLKIGTDVLGLVEFASESEFDESVLERLQNTRHQLSEVIARMQVERSLRESNEKFRRLSEELEERVRERTAEVQDLYDNAPTGYHSLDGNGRFLQINQTELNWLGYTRDELIGRPIQEILTPDSIETFRRNFPVFKQTGQLRDIELEFICKDGAVLPGLVNAIAIYDENGKYVMSRSTLFDNTERRKAEHALLESRENLQYFFDTASDLIQSMDENGSYLYVNAAWSKTLGYTAEEASHLRMLDVIDPSYHEHCRAMLSSLIIDQHPQQLEVIFRTKQGQEVIVEGSVSSRKDKTGHIATNGIFRNITERKRAEEALRQSEATYRALFESTNDAIFLIDMNHKIVRSNSRAPELLGYASAEDILGQDANQFVDNSQFTDANDHMTQLIQVGRLPLYERKFVRKNGEKIDTEINLSLIKDLNGRPMLMQSVVRDISQRKAVEQTLLLANSELERALRMKDEFLANMSHELRTPLNAILGLSESLFEGTAGPVNEKQGHYLITINESGRHLLNLINDILDLAKIESGQIKLELQNIRIQEVCQASMRMVKQLAQKKNQTISLDLSAEVDLVRADERRLKQMIVNLLSNAIKFTPENGKLGLEVKADQSRSSISIAVWDQGIGIAEADIQRLFQPFVQLDSSLARESGGTGLGLALVAEMARLHGGSVSVESKVEHGSRFTIHLPWSEALTLSVEPEPVKKSTGRLVEKLGVQKNNVHTILIVEDTEHVLMMLGDYLTQNGYRVAIANNGLEGVEKARSLMPDLILMDVQMPGMDGLEATRRIRQEAGLGKTPIIALTALAMPSDRDRCLEAGMTDYISKPVNLKNLANTIQKYISDPVTGKETRKTS